MMKETKTFRKAVQAVQATLTLPRAMVIPGVALHVLLRPCMQSAHAHYQSCGGCQRRETMTAMQDSPDYPMTL